MRTINLCLKPVLASVLALGNIAVFAEESSQQHADHSMHHQQSLQSSEHHLTSVAPEVAENLIPDSASTYSSEHDHRKEHGGQIYTQVKLDNKWIKNSEGEGGYSLRMSFGLARMKINCSLNSKLTNKNPEQQNMQSKLCIAGIFQISGMLRRVFATVRKI